MKRIINHPLDRWLQDRGIKQYVFADERLGISAKHLSRIIHGANLSRQLARAIERETAGGVTALELLRIAGAQKPRRKSPHPRGGGSSRRSALVGA